MLFLIGTFGLNFPIFISTMAVGEFHADARAYGLLSSMMAVGTVAGALFNAQQERPRFVMLIASSAFSRWAVRWPRWRRPIGPLARRCW
jgi:hypothetical protein